MPRKTVKSSSSLGKQLIKSKMKPKFKHVENEGPECGYRVHTTFEHKNASKPQLSSVLEQNSLEQFIDLAKLS